MIESLDDYKHAVVRYPEKKHLKTLMAAKK